MDQGRNQGDEICLLNKGRLTDALEQLIEFNLVLQLSVALSFLLLRGTIGTNFTANRYPLSRC
jgi:hypothetical protein